jgi:hypothetical protein
MKKSFILMLFSVLLSSLGFAQTAVSNCNQVILTGLGSVPLPTRTTFGPLLLVKYGRTDQYCNWVCARPSDYEVLNRAYQLLRTDPLDNSQTVIQIKYGTTLPTFSNVPPGIYTVKILEPQEPVEECSYTTWWNSFVTVKAPFRVYNLLGQCIGHKADSHQEAGGGGPFTFSNFEVPTYFTLETNQVIVGQSKLYDNVWNFTGQASVWMGNTVPPPFPLYSATDIVKIDATESANYNQYLVAIQEFYPDGITQGRWRQLNKSDDGFWANGKIGIFNLSYEWGNNTGWTFNPYFTYRVQVVIRNKDCPSWTQQLRTFAVCTDPQSSCRMGGEKIEKIMMSPNPAYNKFQLSGVDFSTDRNYKVSVSDMSGREIKIFENVKNNEFNIADFVNGVYIVNLMEENRKLFSNKLIVNK